jgi:outer membrane receptor protein involved in Fe transport
VLEPETINTAEVVCERYNADGFRVSVSGFRYSVEGLITPVLVDRESGDLGFVNGEDLTVSGVELEAERVWSHGWQALASFAFQQPRSDLSGSSLSNSPRQLARLRLSGPLVSDRLTFGVDSLITSARLAVDGRQSDAFGLANLTIRTARPFAGLTLSFHLDNLLDRRYTDPGGEEHPVSLIRQDGRTAALKASWKF